MKRLFLIGSMVISLWPIALIGVSVAGGSSKPATESTASEPSEEAQSPAKTDESSEGYNDELKELDREQTELSKLLDVSNAFRGTPDRFLAQRAAELRTEFSKWAATYGPIDEKEAELARLKAKIDGRIQKFASAPSKARLDAVNEAVQAYNSRLPAGAK